MIRNQLVTLCLLISPASITEAQTTVMDGNRTMTGPLNFVSDDQSTGVSGC